MDNYEDDDWTPALRAKLLIRAEAEAAWLRGSVSRDNAQTNRTSVAEDARERRIREAAYFNAERRGFAPGHEIEDWLAAEAALAP
jgi:hypothetical protein